MGIFTFTQKLRVGLQQLMAGSRNFKLATISRHDLMALTEEAAKISGIPYVMEAYRAEAESILCGASEPGTAKKSKPKKMAGIS